MKKRELPEIGKNVRIGKNAYWLALQHNQNDWRSLLLKTIKDYIEVSNIEKIPV